MLNVKKNIDNFIDCFEKKVGHGLPNKIKEHIHNREWEEDRYACCMDAENSDFLFICHMKDVFSSGCMQ